MRENDETGEVIARPAARRSVVAAAVVFVTTCAYRFIGLDLTNDDLLFLAIGRQIAVFGEWPVRDLFEEGDPLHNVVTAVLQRLFGHALAGEAVFDVLMLAVAAALTAVAATRILRSAAAGGFVAMLTVVVWPRLYDYPKALVPAAALLLCAQYPSRPRPVRAAVLGAICAVAFLLRHDLGAYAVAATVVAIVATRWSQRIAIGRPFAAWMLVMAILAMPYLLWVQAYSNIPDYFASTRRFTERELARSDDLPPSFAFDPTQPLWRSRAGRAIKIRWAEVATQVQREAAEQQYGLTGGRNDQGRTWAYVVLDTSDGNLAAIVRDPLVEDTASIDRSLGRGPDLPPPSWLKRLLSVDAALAPGILTHRNAVAWAYYIYRVLPIAALLVAALVLGRTRSLATVLPVLPPLAFCAACAPLLLRGNLYENSRLADFTTPAVLLAIPLCAMAWRHPMPRAARYGLRSGMVAVVAISTLALCSVGQAGSHLTAIATLADEGRLDVEASRLWQGLTATPPRLDWIAREGGVRGSVEYLQQCTAPSDRVLMFGFYPETLFYSGRGAASDRIVLQRGFGVSPDDERRTVAALTRHPAALVIVEATVASGSTAARTLDGLHPLVERFIESHYSRVATTGFGGSTAARFDVWLGGRSALNRPGPFGLPCR